MITLEFRTTPIFLKTIKFFLGGGHNSPPPFFQIWKSWKMWMIKTHFRHFKEILYKYFFLPSQNGVTFLNPDFVMKTLFYYHCFCHQNTPNFRILQSAMLPWMAWKGHPLSTVFRTIMCYTFWHWVNPLDSAATSWLTPLMPCLWISANLIAGDLPMVIWGLIHHDYLVIIWFPKVQ